MNSECIRPSFIAPYISLSGPNCLNYLYDTALRMLLGQLENPELENKKRSVSHGTQNDGNRLRACLVGTEGGSTVPFPHTNGPFPSVTNRKEPSFYYGNGRRTERNRSNRTGSKSLTLVFFFFGPSCGTYWWMVGWFGPEIEMRVLRRFLADKILNEKR